METKKQIKGERRLGERIKKKREGHGTKFTKKVDISQKYSKKFAYSLFLLYLCGRKNNNDCQQRYVRC